MYPYALLWEKSLGSSRKTDLSARNWVYEVHLYAVEGALATKTALQMNWVRIAGINQLRELPWFLFFHISAYGTLRNCSGKARELKNITERKKMYFMLNLWKNLYVVVFLCVCECACVWVCVWVCVLMCVLMCACVRAWRCVRWWQRVRHF